jgi:hypothetical protein
MLRHAQLEIGDYIYVLDEMEWQNTVVGCFGAEGTIKTHATNELLQRCQFGEYEIFDKSLSILYGPLRASSATSGGITSQCHL